MKRITTDEGGDDCEPLHRTLEWARTFRAQLTPRLMNEARRYARVKTKKVALVRVVDPSYAEDLVHDIIDRTMHGKVAWDPARVSLKKHLFDAIKSRARHAYNRGVRFKDIEFERCPEEVESKLADEQRRRAEVAAHRDRMYEVIRGLAHQDPEILMILDAYDQGIFKRFRVISHTGLTSQQFDAARKRILRLIDRLPATFRRAPDEAA